MTIAQQLKVKDFPFEIKDKNGNKIYFEDCHGYWYKHEYDSNGNKIYSETSEGYWEKREYDSNGNRIYFENCNGFWAKREYDSNGNVIYFENSNGEIINKRPKPVVELTLDEIATKFNIPVNQLKIKK
jgi:hypothetical protein